MIKTVVYQLLNLKSAERSQALTGTPQAVRGQLELLVPESSRDDFAVIVLCDGSADGFEFSRCPVLSVSQFLKVESLQA